MNGAAESALHKAFDLVLQILVGLGWLAVVVFKALTAWRKYREAEGANDNQGPERTVIMKPSNDTTAPIGSAVGVVLRHGLTTAGGVLVGNGTITEDALQQAVAAVMVLAGLAWSALHKWRLRRAAQN